jgi:hypothetical protein
MAFHIQVGLNGFSRWRATTTTHVEIKLLVCYVILRLAAATAGVLDMFTVTR